MDVEAERIATAIAKQAQDGEVDNAGQPSVTKADPTTAVVHAVAGFDNSLYEGICHNDIESLQKFFIVKILHYEKISLKNIL